VAKSYCKDSAFVILFTPTKGNSTGWSFHPKRRTVQPAYMVSSLHPTIRHRYIFRSALISLDDFIRLGRFPPLETTSEEEKHHAYANRNGDSDDYHNSFIAFAYICVIIS